MKIKLITSVLMLLTLGSFAQTPESELSDSLVGNKEVVLKKYLPMANGQLLFKAYEIPLDVFVGKINDFKAAMNAQIDSEKNQTLKNLKREDVEFYTYKKLTDYRMNYGLDSVGQEKYFDYVFNGLNTPDKDKRLDSLLIASHLKYFTKDEYSFFDSLKSKYTDPNQGALFKTSASYREFLDSYLKKLASVTKCDSLGDNEDLVILKVISAQINDPFIREYLLYTTTGKIIMNLENNKAEIERVYNDFMGVVTKSTYKADIQKLYSNYTAMSSHTLAPEFAYADADGRQVSLKSLRGKYVYIDVWATWCIPCKMEIPFLTKVEEDYKGKNIHFVSISVDKMANQAKWHDYVKDNKLQGIQLLADKDFKSDFMMKFNVNSIPRFILIDPNGKIVSGDAKRPSDPKLRQELDQLLK
ncbi:TlpA family protein disulfide reductase [Pedobacter cryoconitis]|uniref:Thiol-disulfide isomerase/thioredoxin n=1 Tax=Pedobacter cryoconitis TaxID=188932 RepID=A0A7X0J110_9SPHI|nr:TlpA disulfide reductase family protein [Pedobacter cryoconitis]MBB6498945.1 thiol-disulfide isomerase/thioredoxin [Pedobacter cryoconitis]